MNLTSHSGSDAVSSSLVFQAEAAGDRQIVGLVYDLNDLSQKFVVELIVDGRSVALARADLMDRALCEREIGDGRYRFSFSLESDHMSASGCVEVRLANLRRTVHIGVSPGYQRVVSPSGDIGEVRWQSGTRFSGWTPYDPAIPTPEVRAFIDGVCIGRTKATGWTVISQGGVAVTARAFDLRVPEELADGRVRSVLFMDQSGRALRGSPCAFFGFADGLRSFIGAQAELESEKIRADVFDARFPRSMPLSDFADWEKACRRTDPSQNAHARIAIALIGEEDAAQATLASLEVIGGRGWVAGILAGGGGQTAFDPCSLSEFLSTTAQGSDAIIFALAGTVFREGALDRLYAGLSAFPGASVGYCDVVVTGEDGGEWPIAFPAFDYERMLEQGYGAHLFVMTHDAARKVAALGGSDIYRLFNLGLEIAGRSGGARTGARASPVHVPGFLARIPNLDLVDGAARLAESTAAHLRSRGVQALVRPSQGVTFPAVHVRRNSRGLKTSIVIPVRNAGATLQSRLVSLRAATDMDEAEIIVVCNESTDPQTVACLEATEEEGIKLVSMVGRPGATLMRQAAASIAKGDFLALLDDDVEASAPGWLDEMLSRAVEPDVGAVGATLLWAGGVIQHAGFVLGTEYSAGNALCDRMEGEPGYSDQLLVAHQVSAVSASCLVTRRNLFLAWNRSAAARLDGRYADLHYCLRLRAEGYRIVHTPHAKLLRGQSRHAIEAIADPERARYELEEFRATWCEVLANDPYYNPMLALDGAPYSGLARPPRSAAPRLPDSAAPRVIPLSF